MWMLTARVLLSPCCSVQHTSSQPTFKDFVDRSFRMPSYWAYLEAKVRTMLWWHV